MSLLTVVPAYGRDYKSGKAACEDWETGKDFLISDISSRYNGKYVSIRDVPQVQVTIRYAKLRKVIIYSPRVS